MKKLLILTAALALLLAACTTTAESPTEETTTEITTTQAETTAVYEQTTLTAELVDADTSADVTFSFGDEEGVNLLVRATVPMHDVAMIAPLVEFADDEMFHTPARGEDIADVILPGQTLLLQNYRSAGTLPNAGLTFTDDAGVSRYFVLVENQAYPQHGPMFWFNEVQNQTAAFESR
ncbi:MAG: hypothetical protein FWD06_05915 [Oscillospiraceae bacterium]|nr:hypothetical protein [Oscillospiraceae bacterium]